MTHRLDFVSRDVSENDSKESRLTDHEPFGDELLNGISLRFFALGSSESAYFTSCIGVDSHLMMGYGAFEEPQPR